MFWTDELKETVKRLWQEGNTGGQIAKIVHKGRSSVLGQLNRMGLIGFRKSGSRPDAVEHRLITRKAKPRKGLRFKAPPIPLPPGAAGRSFNGVCGPIYDIMELKLHHCRWPIGDPQDPNFCYCGAHTDKGPYCAPHNQIAYAPPLWRVR